MKNKFVCDKSLTFQECELAILRNAVDLAENKMGKQLVNTPDVQQMIKIVEDFINRKNLICYGGVAIDALLPESDKIYDKNVELSDYDFYTPNALEHAKELADIFVQKGYTEVEAKAGSHFGTFKVFCNFLAVADLTYMPAELFKVLKKESIRVKGILYCPPNFLKMAMYLELSRPAGQIDRFEKVFKRLTLLNKYYPITSANCGEVDFQRPMENQEDEKESEIYENVKNTFVNQGVVFFGGMAMNLFSHYLPKKKQKSVRHIADFDVLSIDPLGTCEIVKERLLDIDVKHVKIVPHKAIGEIIPEHYEILVNKETIAFVYKPIACHSYNVITIKGQHLKVATIDTMLSFYLAFLYTERPYYTIFADRILCMSKFLFEVQQQNRLAQKGLLRRFSITCYGHQESVEEMRSHKNEMFQQLKGKRGTKEYEEWFLNYKPGSPILGKNDDISEEVEEEKPSKQKKVKRRKTKKHRRTSATARKVFNFKIFKSKKNRH
uniref:Poly(A) polymerase catalytic subunit domain-containing protein n=1 Tax=viral metagenome TaxID=1070528 RepID=A0A6C0E941_9ZZZZ